MGRFLIGHNSGIVGVPRDLLLAEGLTLEEISARSGLNRTNCLKWRERLAAEGLDGLKDKPPRGRPASITPWQRAEVVRLARERPFTGANAWSRREARRCDRFGKHNGSPDSGRCIVEASQGGAARALILSLSPSRRQLSCCI